MELNVEEVKLEVERLRQEAEAQTDWEKKNKIFKKMEKLIRKVDREHIKVLRNGNHLKYDVKNRYDWTLDHLAYIAQETVNNVGD